VSSSNGDGVRLPPQNKEAEMSVLGAMLRANHVIDIVSPLLIAEHFYLDAHQKVFGALLAMRAAGQAADMVTLTERLAIDGKLEDVGGAPYIYRLLDESPTASNATHYAEIVREKSVLRNLIHIATEVLRDAYNQSAPADELLQDLEKKIFALAQTGAIAEPRHISEIIPVVFERIDARRQGNIVAGVSTGFPDLDAAMGGLHNSEVTVIGARPSVGKTALGLALAANAIKDGRGVLLSSIEQACEELGERLLCMESGIDSHLLRTGIVGSNTADMLNDAREVLHNKKLWIDDASPQKMLRIASQARKFKRQHDIGLVIIDYLQLIEPEEHRMPREQQVSAISRRIKGLARELKIPVVALAQLNRSGEDEPTLANLRESGAIEQDADNVLLLHRSKENPDVIECVIAKQRNGPRGRKRLYYRKQCVRFESYSDLPPYAEHAP